MAICSDNQIKYETENSLDYEVQNHDEQIFRKRLEAISEEDSWMAGSLYG